MKPRVWTVTGGWRQLLAAILKLSRLTFINLIRFWIQGAAAENYYKPKRSQTNDRQIHQSVIETMKSNLNRSNFSVCFFVFFSSSLNSLLHFYSRLNFFNNDVFSLFLLVFFIFYFSFLFGPRLCLSAALSSHPAPGGIGGIWLQTYFTADARAQ